MTEEKYKNLSEKIWDKASYGLDKKFVFTKDIKEFINIVESRISNQLRIHWGWLKKKNPKEVAEFINNIINKKAGEKLITK